MPFYLLKIKDLARWLVRSCGDDGSKSNGQQKFAFKRVSHCSNPECNICLGNQKREELQLQNVVATKEDPAFPTVFTVTAPIRPEPTYLQRSSPYLLVTCILLLLTVLTLTTLALMGLLCFEKEENIVAAVVAGNVTTVQNIECSEVKRDICIILDTSASIEGHQYASALSFLNNLIDSMPLASTGTHVSMIVFDQKPEIVFTNLFDRNVVRKRIAAAPHKQGGTNIPLALKAALENVYLRHFRKNDTGVLPLFLLLTDGKSTDEKLIPEIAAKIAKKGITTLAVGIGNSVIESQLLNVANGNREHVFHTMFGKMNEIQKILQKSICSE